MVVFLDFKNNAKERAVAETKTGVVKWFNDQKGYGFIVPDDGSKDLFIHQTNVEMEGFRSLKEGQKVEFESANGKKGPEAQKCRPI